MYAVPSPDWDVEMKDERRFRLEQVAKEQGEAFVYEYDLGDSWRHQVLVEAIQFETGPAGETACLVGERACPPEDSGGVHGYYEKLECVRDKRHPEHREMKQWLEGVTGGPFDPEAFDLESVNAALKRLR